MTEMQPMSAAPKAMGTLSLTLRFIEGLAPAVPQRSLLRGRRVKAGNAMAVSLYLFTRGLVVGAVNVDRDQHHLWWDCLQDADLEKATEIRQRLDALSAYNASGWRDLEENPEIDATLAPLRFQPEADGGGLARAYLEICFPGVFPESAFNREFVYWNSIPKVVAGGWIAPAVSVTRWDESLRRGLAFGLLFPKVALTLLPGFYGSLASELVGVELRERRASALLTCFITGVSPGTVATGPDDAATLELGRQWLQIFPWWGWLEAHNCMRCGEPGQIGFTSITCRFGFRATSSKDVWFGMVI